MSNIKNTLKSCLLWKKKEGQISPCFERGGSIAGLQLLLLLPPFFLLLPRSYLLFQRCALFFPHLLFHCFSSSSQCSSYTSPSSFIFVQFVTALPFIVLVEILGLLHLHQASFYTSFLTFCKFSVINYIYTQSY